MAIYFSNTYRMAIYCTIQGKKTDMESKANDCNTSACTIVKHNHKIAQQFYY